MSRRRSTSAPDRPSISAPDRLRLQTDIPPRPQSIISTPSASPSPHLVQLPSFSLVGALEFRQVVASLRHQAASSSLSMFDSPVTPFAGGHYRAHSTPRRSSRASTLTREEDPWEAALGLQRLTSPALTPPEESRRSSSPSTIPSIMRTPASPTISEDSEAQTYVPPTKRQRAMSLLGRIAYTLFPSLHNFESQSVLGQFASIFAAPAILLLTITLPVAVTPYISADTSREKIHGDGRLVDFEEEGVERILIAEEEVMEDMHELIFNKWLMAVQCMLAPVFSVGVLASSVSFSSYFEPCSYYLVLMHRGNEIPSATSDRGCCQWLCDSCACRGIC